MVRFLVELNELNLRFMKEVLDAVERLPKFST